MNEAIRNGIIDDYKNFVSYETIMEKYGISKPVLINTVRKAGLKYLIGRDYRHLNYPENLLYDMYGETVSSDKLEDISAGIEYVLTNKVKQRDADIVRMYYNDEFSLRRIAGVVGVTIERVRQIRLKTVRKLRLAPQVRHGLKGYEERMIEESKHLEKMFTNLNKSEIPISSLNLSIRSYNCLKRHNINTVGGIKSVKQLMSIRNLGRKCLEEIYAKLTALGYVLPLE